MIKGETPVQNTLVLHPRLPRIDTRHEAYMLEEAVGLAEALGVTSVSSEIVNLRQVNAAQYLGSGKVDDIRLRCKADNITLVIINGTLSPIQQRNLERAIKVKVIDRTALIQRRPPSSRARTSSL